MTSRSVEIDVPVALSRYQPPPATAAVAAAYQASGVIDSLSVWDQMGLFHPPSLWTAENSAAALPDLESSPDPFSLLGYVAAAAPNMNFAINTDTVRRSPGELMQALLTLGPMTSGDITIGFGAGEIKQCKPFGWKRSQGLARMEDHFRAFRAFLDTDGPVDLEGNHWHLQTAVLGNGGKDRRYRLRGLGGGPRLIELTAEYADGFSTGAPCVASSPERLAEIIDEVNAVVEQKGRDPKNFEYSLYPVMCLIHEDENVLDRALDNPLMRWMTATIGRINQTDWEREGFNAPMPDWHYAMKLLPQSMSQADVDEGLSRVTREMSERTWIWGTPEQVATELASFVDAGATWIHIADTLPLITAPDDAAESPRRVIETARLIKQAVG